MESAHLAEVLEAVGRNYLFDRNRVTLMGMCSAHRWLSMPAQAGGRFAGIAVLNRNLSSTKTCPETLWPLFRKKGISGMVYERRSDECFSKEKLPMFLSSTTAATNRGMGFENIKGIRNQGRACSAPVRLKRRPEGRHIWAHGRI
ncbi:hypothetical protein OH491_05230 [Termitidicoccus mucosus]|uniref:hypothetical protein n=1 Tax=Termitidicoccus mucosus TaxID=1184151 RepID=UPI003182E82A